MIIPEKLKEVEKVKIVIVGGVAGGASAAARLRRLDEKAEIVMFEKSGYISYANCGLPYYIGGEITDSEELTLQTPQSFNARFNVDVRVNREVIDINRQSKTVTVLKTDSGKTYEESYDKLILAPGAKPIVPNFPGVENERIFTLRNVEDTFKIKSFIDEKQPKSAVVIGGGFIGLEMAENLVSQGVEVTLAEKMPQLLGTLDSDLASFVHAKFASKGVNLKLGVTVKGFESRNGKIAVLADEIPETVADMVVLALGVTPDSLLASKAGLELGMKGSIAVNSHMQTSDPDIYAVGDAVEVEHFVTKQPALISLAGPANKQGRIAADNIYGISSVYQGSQGSSVIKLFDMTAATTGINEKQAKALGLDYDKVTLSPSSHAGYYPGGKVMTLKVIYEKKTLKILGAQIVGSDGVDKRIDVIAVAIRAGLSAIQLKDLDLAYAPPYSSAKDPVNMAGFMIENIENGLVKQFHYDDIAELRNRNDCILLDTRTNTEYSRGHAEGFVHIPVDTLRDRLDELDKSKKVYVMCQSGLRSYIACRILSQNGYDCYNFSGGYRLYNSIKNDVVPADKAYPCGMEK